MIIPAPSRCVRHPGSFPVPSRPCVDAGPGAEQPARLLADYLGPGACAAPGSGSAIRLELTPGSAFSPEGYRLRITPDEVRLTAPAEAGLRHGVQTLRQLLPVDPTDRRWPCLEITDEPRMGWRGAVLDVARHFLPLEFLFQFVEELALHKLNVLQLHLTDDQGWRIEIDGLPRLTEVGAWRTESMVGPAGSARFDGIPHGGYYTQGELRALVAHAADRGITVVPEIEMPGHARAAIAAYPHLGNQPERQLSVWTSWGICEDVFGVHDQALDFCRTVLNQTADVFPSPYLHLGGDECPPTRWQSSPAARARASELGLADPRLLHAWFLDQMRRHVESLGRTAICWDETGQAGGALPTDMVLAAWRDPAHGVAAVARGHQVLMAPHTSTYLDYRQSAREDEPQAQPGYTVTLADVHGFDPLAGGLPAVEPGTPHAGVLGTQAHLWSEFVPTPDHLRYLAYPRLCALAESAWSAPGGDFTEFTRRLDAHLSRLRALGALRDRPGSVATIAG